MSITVYGIPNCDTVKKARAWLTGAGVAHSFHDYRKQGIDAQLLTGWIADVGWEALLNRSGTTFRGLADSEKAGLDAPRAMALMLAAPGMIRRPVLVGAGPLHIGFKPDAYAALFGQAGCA